MQPGGVSVAVGVTVGVRVGVGVGRSVTVSGGRGVRLALAVADGIPEAVGVIVLPVGLASGVSVGGGGTVIAHPIETTTRPQRARTYLINARLLICAQECLRGAFEFRPARDRLGLESLLL